jgi:hypothetical protein
MFQSNIGVASDDQPLLLTFIFSPVHLARLA